MTTLPRRLAFVSLIFVSFACTGCVSSLRPLTDEKSSTPDLRLLGVWEFEEEKEVENGGAAEKDKKGASGKTQIVKHTITVERKKDAPNVLVASTIEEGKKETGELLLTKIGKDYFVSLGNKDDQGVLKYMIAKYELAADGTLKFWGFDTEFFAKAVESKELKGTIKQEVFKDVTLDDTPENLRKFLEKHGAKCFMSESEITMKRIKKGQ
jgi:hypothetical protein